MAKRFTLGAPEIDSTVVCSVLVDLEFKGKFKIAKGFPGNENAAALRVAVLSADEGAVLDLPLR